MDPRDLFWNEDGELVSNVMYSSDATIDDIPRIMREHKSLRIALYTAVQLLQKANIDSTDPKTAHDLAYVNTIKKQLPI